MASTPSPKSEPDHGGAIGPQRATLIAGCLFVAAAGALLIAPLLSWVEVPSLVGTATASGVDLHGLLTFVPGLLLGATGIGLLLRGGVGKAVWVEVLLVTAVLAFAAYDAWDRINQAKALGVQGRLGVGLWLAGVGVVAAWAAAWVASQGERAARSAAQPGETPERLVDRFRTLVKGVRWGGAIVSIALVSYLIWALVDQSNSERATTENLESISAILSGTAVTTTTPQETEFLTRVRGAAGPGSWVTELDDGELLALGHGVCSQFDQGADAFTIIASLGHTVTDEDAFTSGLVAGAAASVFCPEYYDW
jgi:hypothetical protein